MGIRGARSVGIEGGGLMVFRRRFDLLRVRFSGLVLPPGVDWDEVIDKGCVIVLAHLRFGRFRRGIRRWLGRGVCKVLVVACVRFPVQSSHSS